MKTKLEIKSFFGKVLFTYESEYNTIKNTLLEAIKQGADLEGADLEDANLEDANLRGANLRGAENKELAHLPIFCKWSFSVIGNDIKIGCKTKSIREWDIFFESSEVYSTERNTEEFKQIEAIYNALKSYLLTLNQ